MSENSSRLSLPFIMPAQAQKHVTHNEALQKLDVLVQTVVEAFDASDPPAAPTEGTTWALGPAPTAAWSGQAHNLATWTNGAWLFAALQQGFTAVEQGGTELMIWDGTTWNPTEISELSNLDGLGVNTDHDSTNRLSVSALATLLTHDGAGHQVKINKAAETDTASLLFQTDWSGRAEMGTVGADDFSIKVSSDGDLWKTALSFDATTGKAHAPLGMEVSGAITGTAVQANVLDETPDRLMMVGAFGLGLAGQSASTPPNNSLDDLETQGFWRYGSSTTGAPSGAGMVLHFTRIPSSSAGGLIQLAIGHTGRLHLRALTSSGWSAWSQVWQASNTTVDANGFLKEASPILRLFDDRTEEPAEPVGASFEKLGVGHYRLSDVSPLSDVGWRIEIPQDSNGNRLVYADTEYDAQNGTLEITTSEVKWQDTWVAGSPKNIPEGRWIDLRFASLNDETEEETGGPT